MTLPQSLVDAICLSQLVVLYGLAAPAGFRLLQRSWLAKNPAWIAEHPAFVQAYGHSRHAIGASYVMGAMWAYILVNGVVNGATDAWPAGVLMYSMLSWVALEAAVAAIDYRRVWLRIPLPNKRRAALTPRSFADFAHPAVVVPGLLLLALMCAAYIDAYVHEQIEVELLAQRIAVLTLGTLGWFVTLRYCVQRKNQAIDEALGPIYRQVEVRAAIACLYLFALAAGFRLLQERYGISLSDDVAFLAVVSVIVQAAALVGCHLLKRFTKE